MSTIRVAVLYGGRSGEHEVSLISAASVLRNLDRTRFDVIPVAIDKLGRWHLTDPSRIAPDAKALPIDPDAPIVTLPPFPSAGPPALVGDQTSSPSTPFDVIFPVMHGPLCEDGTLQGFFELADVPYVGCGVVASSVGMDKDIAKRIARDTGLPVVPWITLRSGIYERNRQMSLDAIARTIGFPCFVKPSNMGSSVGVSKVKTPADLPIAIESALQYDTKVLVEKAIDCREIEVAVLQSLQIGDAPIVSIAGEIVPRHEFYSYEAKYLDENGAGLSIPANLTDAQQARVRHIAADAFAALECEGLARCDFLMDKHTGAFYFNEVNTMPGFTSISMYPKLMAASGVPYPQLLSHLIDLAMARQTRKNLLQRDYAGSL